MVDLVRNRAFLFGGENGEELIEIAAGEWAGDARVAEAAGGSDQVAALVTRAEEGRAKLLEALMEVDDDLMEMVLMEEEPTGDDVAAAIRRATISLDFIPVLMGSAFKNKGVQPLLDAVVDYLPCPTEVTNSALDTLNDEASVELACSPDEPFVGLAFKLEESRHGQLTYIRAYQGTLKRGDNVVNVSGGLKRVKIPRLVKMHSSEMQDIDKVEAGDICATFDLEVASGDTLVAATARDTHRWVMTSMHVPEPVMSLAVAPKARDRADAFSKALGRFQREDPTFRVHLDKESGETIISGMGELHLDVYVERMAREYDVECTVSPPRVAYRETLSFRAPFDYIHKKQSGGSGQYGKVVGHIEPIRVEGQEPYAPCCV